MEFDMSLLLKVPDDYDVNKIGFILLDDDTDNNDTDNEEDSMDIDFELTPAATNTAYSDPPTCHICVKTFSSRSNLKRHLNNFHVFKSGFECKDCGKSFEKQAQLSGHARIHGQKAKTKPSSYTCDHCGKNERSHEAICQHLEIHQRIYAIDIDDIF